jgi:hypothetical protein
MHPHVVSGLTTRWSRPGQLRRIGSKIGSKRWPGGSPTGCFAISRPLGGDRDDFASEPPGSPQGFSHSGPNREAPHKPMPHKKCRACGLWNPSSAMFCHCAKHTTRRTGTARRRSRGVCRPRRSGIGGQAPGQRRMFVQDITPLGVGPHGLMVLDYCRGCRYRLRPRSCRPEEHRCDCIKATSDTRC